MSVKERLGERIEVYIIYCASRDILIRQARQVPSRGVPVACVISSALSHSRATSPTRRITLISAPQDPQEPLRTVYLRL